MKKIRIISRNPFSILIILFSFLLVSCGKDYTTDVKSKHDMTGEELFKSIFFGVGDYADNITHLNEVKKLIDGLDKEKYQEYLNGVNLITKTINDNNKKSAKDLSTTFFDDFKASINSNDPFAVEFALNIASKEIVDALIVIKPDFEAIKNDFVANMDINDLQNSLGEIDKQKAEEVVSSYLSSNNLLDNNLEVII